MCCAIQLILEKRKKISLDIEIKIRTKKSVDKFFFVRKIAKLNHLYNIQHLVKEEKKTNHYNTFKTRPTEKNKAINQTSKNLC